MQLPFCMSISLLILFLGAAPISKCNVGEEEGGEYGFSYKMSALVERDNNIKSHNTELTNCFGKRKDLTLSVLKENFPSHWPAIDSEDPVCADEDSAQFFLCTSEQIIFYLNHILQSDDPEKIPNTKECDSSIKGGCWPGFWDYKGETRACCDGFFCPVMLTCMIPCPLGSYCTKTAPRHPPRGYGKGAWCAPYTYKARAGKCGGAHRWIVSPVQAFPNSGWKQGSGNIYCPGGYYCSNTTGPAVPCPDDHQCREGSKLPKRCPPLVRCKEGTEMPQENNRGLVFDGVVLTCLFLLWRASKVLKWLMQKMSAQDRAKIQYGVHPNVEVTAESDSILKANPGDNGALEKTQSSEGSPMVSGRDSESRSKPNSDPELACDSQCMSEMDDGSTRINEMDLAVDGKALGFLGDYSLESDGVGERNVRHIKIEFYGVSLRLKSSSKTILTAASGVFHKARLTAILGPSGAGKTSLLNALSGNAGYGIVSGVVLVNGKRKSMEKYKPVMGFVPQDDIMHRDLTVEENLLFSAKYRLPASTSHAKITSSVDRAIMVLGLNNVRNELIGNEEARGISGGQRKRVNMGLEIVADPLVLFLDEPTSGLDSSSCKQVVSALHTIAHMGVTSVAVIHQPSYRIFTVFDDILLMANGGHTVYNGPQEKVQEYFEKMGFSFPLHANPADIYMDILMGQYGAQGWPDLKIDDLVIRWRESDMWVHSMTDPSLEMQTSDASKALKTRVQACFGIQNGSVNLGGPQQGFFPRMCGQIGLLLYAIAGLIARVLGLFVVVVTTVKKLTTVRESGSHTTTEENSLPLHRRQTPGFVRQYWWCLRRALVQKFRAPLAMFIEYIFFAVSGAALGLMADSRRKTVLFLFLSDSLYNFVSIGLLSAVTGLRTFGLSRVIFFRESASGINRFAYYLALDSFGMMDTLLHALCYLLPYYSYARPHADFGAMYLIVFALMHAWKGLAYSISQVLQYSTAQVVSAVLVLLITIMARPTIKSEGFIKILSFMSFPRFAMEAVVIAQAIRFQGVWILERCFGLYALGISVSSFRSAMFWLVGVGCGLRVLACALLFITDRNKQL